jgi:hypothetical protein
MIEANLDQPLAHGKRHQPLSRLPRYAKLSRDFVLSVAGDIVEPARSGGVVQPRTLAFCIPAHAGSSKRSAKVRVLPLTHYFGYV